MKEHELKCLPNFFSALLNGSKTFDARRNDRDFVVGDVLLLKEWIQEEYTGRTARFRVTYVLHGGNFGIENGFCVLGIAPESEPRESVAWFARRMEKKLRANDHKGGWDDCSNEYLLHRMIEERRELTNAVAAVRYLSPDLPETVERVVNEAADVANFAMMIADNYRKLLE